MTSPGGWGGTQLVHHNGALQKSRDSWLSLLSGSQASASPLFLVRTAVVGI